MLNNFPIHLYDDKIVDGSTLNTTLLGLRLSDGYPINKYKDSKEDILDLANKQNSYLNDPLYKKFLDGHYKWADRKKNNDGIENEENDSRNKKYLRTNRHTFSVKEEVYNGSAAMLVEYLQNAFDTGIYYYGEEGQFRNKDERKQALELFCYPIGLFDFAKTNKLVEEASLFTQARSLMKSAAWFGIPFNDIEFEKLLKVYYEKEIKTEKDWIDIKDRLDKFYKSCLL